MASPAQPGTQASAATYWNRIAEASRSKGDQGAWRMVSDAINRDLIAHWLPAAGVQGHVLKTDLFDEVVGSGLVAYLSTRFASVTAVDLSDVVVDTARWKHPGLTAVTADVRALPFPDGCFDAIVSNSTLDHFPSTDDIAAALAELGRVLAPGGTLLVTLDNPVNPVVALRNALPRALRDASGLVPYAVGATCGPRRLHALLGQASFDVSRLGAIFHFPRVLAVLGARPVDRFGGETARRRYVRSVTAFEGLSVLPTRYLTGYFVAALAVKR